MTYAERTLAEFTTIVTEPKPAGSAGAVTSVTASLAAGLVVKACALTRDGSLGTEEAHARELVERLARFATDDEDAFARVLAAEKGSRRGPLSEAAAGARTFAASCNELAKLAEDVAARCTPHVSGEPAVAAMLARAAAAAGEAIAVSNDPR